MARLACVAGAWCWDPARLWLPIITNIGPARGRITGGRGISQQESDAALNFDTPGLSRTNGSPFTVLFRAMIWFPAPCVRVLNSHSKAIGDEWRKLLLRNRRKRDGIPVTPRFMVIGRQGRDLTPQLGVPAAGLPQPSIALRRVALQASWNRDSICCQRSILYVCEDIGFVSLVIISSTKQSSSIPR
jgi:hypothetical protein